MSTELPTSDYRGGGGLLCAQCSLMFSNEGLSQLFSARGFHHSKVATFGERRDCRFCRYLWSEDFVGSSNQPQPVRRLRDLTESEPERSSPATQPLRSSRAFRQAPQCWVVFLAPESHYAPWEHLALRVESESGRLLWQPLHPLRVVASTDSPYSGITRYRPLVWGDGLTAEWAVALRAVIAECQSARGLHNYCKPQDLAPLPTRVLQIAAAAEAEASDEVGGSFAKVRLHITPQKGQGEGEGQGQLGRYAALSYCWGGPQEVRLTRDNLDILQEGIPDAENRLPQTLRDAVVATQLLGLEYLWVDALCIMQDDPADKAREIDRMCAIYENSAVTLVAATARSVHDGFLRPAAVVNERFASCELEVSFSPSFFFDKEKSEMERETVGESTRSGGGASGSDSGSRGSTLIFTPMHRHHTEAFPINARGWTFQESFIPPRALVFGDQEPFLRCRSGDDIVATKTCVRYDLTSRMRPRRLVTRHLKIEGVRLDDVADRLADVWPQVVEEYTARELSFPLEDRPLAVRGVIDFLSAAFGGDTCRFGVWASCPVACLLWQKTIVHGNDGGSWESVRIPHLPTWSWMSVTGQVDLYHMILLGNHRGLAQVQFDDEKQQQQPHNEHHQLFIACHVLMEEEVHQAGDITEFRLDLTVLGSRIDQEGKVIVAGSDKDEVYSLLVLASTVDRKLLAIAATSASEDCNDTYQRCGLVEIKNRDKWLLNAKRRVVLM